MKCPTVWNIYARAYDVINKNIPYLKTLDDVINETHMTEGLTILDAGCGTGNLLTKMSESFINNKYTGIDSSEEMLTRARNKLYANPRVTLLYADLNQKLQLPDESFDRIVSVNALYALEKPGDLISEFHRLLKHDGKLVFVNPHDTSTFSGIMKQQLKELGPLIFFIKFILNLPSLLVIIFINTLFLKKNKNYWSRETATDILGRNKFVNIKIRLTYADQAILVSADNA